jgi:hypothetical protein
MKLTNKKKDVLNKATAAAKNLGSTATNATSNIIHITTTTAGSIGAAGLAMSGIATSTQVLEGVINNIKPITTVCKARGLAGLTGKMIATTHQGGKVIAKQVVTKAEASALAAANAPISVPLAGVGAAAALAGISAAITYTRISNGYRAAKILQKQAKQRLEELDISEEEVAEND